MWKRSSKCLQTKFQEGLLPILVYSNTVIFSRWICRKYWHWWLWILHLNLVSLIDTLACEALCKEIFSESSNAQPSIFQGRRNWGCQVASARGACAPFVFLGQREKIHLEFCLFSWPISKCREPSNFSTSHCPFFWSIILISFWYFPASTHFLIFFESIPNRTRFWWSHRLTYISFYLKPYFNLSFWLNLIL